MTVYELGACPVCGTQQSRVLANTDAVKQQLESLWQFHTRRLRPGAPIQQLFDRAVFSQDPPLQVVQCMHCRTVRRAPREAPDALVGVYEGEEPPHAALESLFDSQLDFFRPRVHALSRMIGQAGSVLEVGSYIGGFLRAAGDDGWSAEGIDVNAGATAFARDKGCTVSIASLDDYGSDKQFDVVALWNCFDQLPDPRAALLRVRGLLKQNGLIALRIPNGACYAAFHDKPGAAGFLALNNLLAFPYRNGFTTTSVASLLADTGFAVRQLRGDTLVDTAGAWTRPWARLEERVLKRIARTVLPAKLSPWLEVFAVMREDPAHGS